MNLFYLHILKIEKVLISFVKIVYYVIHNTHSIAHIEQSMRSFQQQDATLIWDKLVIKNSIEEQIPNEVVKGIIAHYQLDAVFSSIEFVLAGPINTTYSDLKDAVSFATAHNASYLLFTKAEYCYSIGSFGFFNQLFASSKKDWVFTPPIVNATELASVQLVGEYMKKKQFIKTDAVTGYDGDDAHRLLKHTNSFFNKVLYKLRLKERPVTSDIANRDIDEEKIYQLIAHNVVLDINVHLFDKESLAKMDFSNDELNMQWGRIRALDRLLEKGTSFIKTGACFALHLFHEIPGARLGRNIKGVRY